MNLINLFLASALVAVSWRLFPVDRIHSIAIATMKFHERVFGWRMIEPSASLTEIEARLFFAGQMIFVLFAGFPVIASREAIWMSMILIGTIAFKFAPAKLVKLRPSEISSSEAN